MAYQRFPDVQIKETGGDEIGVIFNGQGWVPERVTNEALFWMNNTSLEEYVTARIVREELMYGSVVIVRSDATRPFWWVLFRMHDTAQFWKVAIIRTFNIWGLARCDPGYIKQWRDIRPIGWIGKRVGLWDS